MATIYAPIISRQSCDNFRNTYTNFFLMDKIKPYLILRTEGAVRFLFLEFINSSDESIF